MIFGFQILLGCIQAVLVELVLWLIVIWLLILKIFTCVMPVCFQNQWRFLQPCQLCVLVKGLQSIYHKNTKRSKFINLIYFDLL